MSRGRKITVIVGASLLGLLCALLVSGMLVVRTEWFRGFLRDKIVSAVNDSTGGRTEIGSISIDARHLKAELRAVVIHGLEPPTAAPLFRARRLEVDLRLLSASGLVGIDSLLLDGPQANVMIFPDGRTNLPQPKAQSSGNKNGLRTMVDLAVRRFDLRDGRFTFAGRNSDFNARGENLHAQLDYNAFKSSYTGEIDLNPLHLEPAGTQPLDANVRLPILLEADRASIADARFTTPGSAIQVSASVDHLTAPRTSAQINARLSVDEVARVAHWTPSPDTKRGPGQIIVDMAASSDAGRVSVQKASLVLGQSQLTASGVLADNDRMGSLAFRASLALDEIGRVLRVPAEPGGTVFIEGSAGMKSPEDFLVRANVNGSNLAARRGSVRLTGGTLVSSITADNQKIELRGLRIGLSDGDLTGSGAIEKLTTFHFAGRLNHFSLQRIETLLAPPAAGYSGVVSGDLRADGNLKNASDLIAAVRLTVEPRTGGVPVSGRISLSYDGRADSIDLAPSYVALPNSRLDVAGSIGQQIRANLTTRNMADFQPLGHIPVTFQKAGTASIQATVQGKLNAPRIGAHVAATAFAVEGRPFTGFSADIQGSSSAVSVANAVLTRGGLDARLSGSVGLRNWKAENSEPVRADATIRNAYVADLLAIAGRPEIPAQGAVTAEAHVTGLVGDPQGRLTFSVTNGTLEGEPFDSLTASAVMTPGSIDMPSLTWIAGVSRLDATARYQHNRGDIRRGTLRAHVASNQVPLSRFRSLVKDRPGLDGSASLSLDAGAAVQPSASGVEFQLSDLRGNGSVRNLQQGGKKLGDVTATVDTNGSAVQYDVNSNLASSTIRVHGESSLSGEHRTTANAQISGLPIDRVLALAGRSDLPLTGTLSTTADVSGTLSAPHATAKLTITNGSAYQQAFTRLQATVNYSDRLVELPDLRVEDAGNTMDLSGSFAHPPNDFQSGQVQFRVRTNQFQLARFRLAQQYRPGLTGSVELSGDGTLSLRPNGAPQFSKLNVNLAAKELALQRTPLGDLTLTSETRGQDVAFTLASNLAHGDIRGSGTLAVARSNSVNAKLTFSNLTYSGLSPLMGGTAPQLFDASADGQIAVSGPTTSLDQVHASLELSKVQIHSITPSATARPRASFELHNNGPIALRLDKSVVTVQSARITGTDADLTLAGTASTGDAGTINLRVNGNANLEVLQAFDNRIFSSGAVTLNAAITGSRTTLSIRGSVQLQNASFNTTDLPNGFSNTNGTIEFTGAQAVIQNVTTESGGGKITLSGSVGYGGPEMQLRVQARAQGVHVRYPDTVTTAANAQLSLTGTTSSSLLSGTVRISEVSLISHTDIGAILNSTATPPATPTVSSGLMAGMKFNVRILTATAVQFRTALAQNLHAEANLTLVGEAQHPGMLGRVTIDEGKLTFFGSEYTVNEGTVAFFDPNQIEPVLNISLSTRAQGIDVTLKVSGPAEKMNLSYSSDPPMQFQDIISLLATGTPPSTDPVLAARQQPPAQQSVGQAGASMLLGQAVANPVSGRLQRLFGVSKLKIDPQVTGASNTAQATLTLEQQINSNITFTYIQDVTQSNPQDIRIEWALNPQWSAILARDYTGEVNLDLFYKKRFH